MGLDIRLTEKDEYGEIEERISTGITHNLVPMWKEADIYNELYNSQGEYANEILNNLQFALKDMRDNPGKYKKLNPPNGWGTYEGALEWLAELISIIEKFPNSVIEISR